MKSQHQVKLHTTKGMLQRAGGKVSQKMFEYMRDTIKLLPSPIKTSRGRGLITYYPESVVRLFLQILLERKGGLTLREIKEKLKAEIAEAFAETEFWRQEFSMRAIPVAEYLRAADQPRSSFKLTLKKGDVLISQGKLEKGKIKIELKALCHSWNGKSMDTLKAIKNNIEALEKIEIAERVFLNVRPS